MYKFHRGGGVVREGPRYENFLNINCEMVVAGTS